MSVHDRASILLSRCALLLGAVVVAGMPVPARAAGPAQTGSGTAQVGASTVQHAMSIAKGAKLWQEVCGSCHNLRDPKELTDAEWDVAMGQMRVRAHLTGLQEREIAAFLKASN